MSGSHGKIFGAISTGSKSHRMRFRCVTSPARVVTDGINGGEAIEIDGQVYWIPLYYDVKLALVKHCPKCKEQEPLPKLTLEQWHMSLREKAAQCVQQFVKEEK